MKKRHGSQAEAAPSRMSSLQRGDCCVAISVPKSRTRLSGRVREGPVLSGKDAMGWPGPGIAAAGCSEVFVPRDVPGDEGTGCRAVPPVPWAGAMNSLSVQAGWL